MPHHAGPVRAPSRSPATPRPAAATRPPTRPAVRSPSHQAARFGMMQQVLQRRSQEAATPAPAAAAPTRSAAPPAQPNRDGLPERLRAGVEALSGFFMGDVRVHRDSPEPAKLGALAYASGSDIHLGPGQEQHLPH